MTTLFISHGPPGSGPSLMMHALANALRATGSIEAGEVIDLPGHDGGDAILRVAAEAGNPNVLASCTPTYLTTPVKKQLDVTWSTLTPVAGLVEDTYLLAVASDAPLHVPADLLARSTTAAAAPRGGNTHIQATLLRKAGANISIAFYGTISDAIGAVESGEAEWTTGVASDFRVGVEARRLRLIASLDRVPRGELPTLRASGIEVEFPLWRGLVAPPALPGGVLQRWELAIASMRGTPAWRDYLASSGMRDLPLNAAAFHHLLAAEDATYRRWTTELNLK